MWCNECGMLCNTTASTFGKSCITALPFCWTQPSLPCRLSVSRWAQTALRPDGLPDPEACGTPTHEMHMVHPPSACDILTRMQLRSAVSLPERCMSSSASRVSHALYAGRPVTKSLSSLLSCNTQLQTRPIGVGLCYPQVSSWHIWMCDNECI